MPGINQDVVLLGRTFHVQSEISDGSSRSIRTEVFVGGKTVASRESAVPGAIEEASLRAAMQEHHTSVVTNLLDRIRRFDQRQRPLFSEPTQSRPPSNPHSSRSAKPATQPPPVLSEEHPLRKAIRVRRIIGELRSRLGIDSRTRPSSEDCQRFEQAVQVLDWIVSHTNFSRLRLDEQLRISLVRDRVRGWLSGNQDSNEADELWLEITTLCLYLTEINNRVDLIEFDIQNLNWIIQECGRSGMTPELFRSVRLSYGRDQFLDHLLDDPKSVRADDWLASCELALAHLEQH